MPWVSRVMGDLSDTLVNILVRITTDNQGRKIQLIEPVILSTAPNDFQLSRVSKPFRRYFSLLVNSLAYGISRSGVFSSINWYR